MNYQAHSTAIIDEGAQIGDGTRIWHWVHICAGAMIGNNCSFGQNVFIGNDVIIGQNVKVQNNVSIYDAITLEDDVFCGPSMVFTNVLNPRSEINRKHEYKRTLVKKGVSIGANATIVCGHALQEYAFIGAGAVVTCDVPAYAIFAGVPARQVGWMCRCGAKLKNSLGEQSCTECTLYYDISGNICRLIGA